MRSVILLAVVLAPIVVRADTSWEQFSEAVDQAQATNRIIDKLTTNDVPNKWRTTVEESVTNSYTKKIFFRGERKVLEVGWSKHWTGARSNMFVAQIYDGGTLVSRINGFGETTFVNPPEESKQYEVTTSIKKDGKVTVEATNGKNYAEFFEVRGRDTHPMDDLEYTKTMLKLEQMKPVVNILVNNIGKDKEEKK